MQMADTHSSDSTEFPSLIDDASFLAELEKLEGEPLASPIARPLVKHPHPQPVAAEDASFLAELDKLEGQPLASPIAQPISKRPHAESAAAAAEAMEPVEVVIPRDVNRWYLHPPPGVEPEPVVHHQPSRAPAVLVILLGLCAGAAGAAMVFHERLAQIIALFAR